MRAHYVCMVVHKTVSCCANLRQPRRAERYAELSAVRDRGGNLQNEHQWGGRRSTAVSHGDASPLRVASTVLATLLVWPTPAVLGGEQVQVTLVQRDTQRTSISADMRSVELPCDTDPRAVATLICAKGSLSSLTVHGFQSRRGARCSDTTFIAQCTQGPTTDSAGDAFRGKLVIVQQGDRLSYSEGVLVRPASDLNKVFAALCPTSQVRWSTVAMQPGGCCGYVKLAGWCE
jgi:hypothetical protein